GRPRGRRGRARGHAVHRGARRRVQPNHPRDRQQIRSDSPGSWEAPETHHSGRTSLPFLGIKFFIFIFIIIIIIFFFFFFFFLLLLWSVFFRFCSGSWVRLLTSQI